MTDTKKKMSEADLQSAVAALIDDSIKLADGELSRQRTKATKYYLGEPIGNEEEGRSQFVMTTVRDGVLGIIPSMLRVIFGAEKPVEFKPRTADKVEQAEQQTDYVSYLFAKQGGFLKTHSVIKDGLLRKMGIFKWGYVPQTRVTTYQEEDVSESQLQMLVQTDGVKLLRAVKKTRGSAAVPAAPPVLRPNGQPASPPQPGTPAVEPTYDIEFKHTADKGEINVWSVPPDEFLFSREARTLDDAVFVGHRTRKTTSELLEMGVKQADIDEHGGDDTKLRDSVEVQARDVTGNGIWADPTSGKANEKHLLVEGYVLVDFDGDGISELRRIKTIGINHFVISNEPANSRPFAVFSPDPEPHTLLGQSYADRLMDLQRLETALMRATLDSLSQSIFPRTAYIDGEANVEDILNTEIGAPIRMRSAGAVQVFDTPFKGKEIFPLLDFTASINESRTGRNKGTVGLDADALQSTTKAGVGAAIASSQEQSELLVRIFAETTLKPMFLGLYGLVVEHQPKEEMVRLRGKWVPIDPREWDADADVIVNVAMGSGLVEQKIGVLEALAAKQEQILQTMGPSNPLVTYAQYGHTLSKALALQGFKDTQTYINDVDPNWQPPQAPPQKTPEQILAETTLQVEKMRVDKDMQIKAGELALDREIKTRKADHEERQATITNELKLLEMNLHYASTTQANQISAEESKLDAALGIHAQEHNQTLAEHDAFLQHDKHLHDKQIAQQAADDASNVANAQATQAATPAPE